jgi:hypothetical protein
MIRAVLDRRWDRSARRLRVVPLLAAVTAMAGCVPLGGPPEGTFVPDVVGIVAEASREGRETTLSLEDGTEVRFDHVVAFEGTTFDSLRKGDLVLYVADVGGNPWVRRARPDGSCLQIREGFAWDDGDRWIFESGLVLEVVDEYERPYVDNEPGGWTSNVSWFCLDTDGRIREGPFGGAI